MIPLRAFWIAFKVSPRSALAAAWAAVRGRRVRARNIIYATAQRNPDYYPLWTAVVEPGKIDAYCRAGGPTDRNPPIVALILGCQQATAKEAGRTASSIKTAFGEAATIYCDVVGGAEQSRCRELPDKSPAEFLRAESLAAPGAWLLPMIAGDEISPHTSRAVRRALANAASPDIVYWDEDRLRDGRYDPWLKPDWDELLFLARDYLTGAALFKLSALSKIKTAWLEPRISRRVVSQAVTTLIGLAEAKPAAVHIPLVLSHRKDDSNFASAADRMTIIGSSWHEPVELAEIGGLQQTLRPRFRSAPRGPTVSVLIPTRNEQALLRTCMAGLMGVQYDAAIEIIVIDNDSDEPSAIEYLAQLQKEGVRVIRHPGPFNFSAMNNRAAKMATGELLCLLNNDVEMVDGTWLDAMVRYAVRPDVGAVGALLCYPDGTVQHAGVAVGTGNAAGHVYRGLPLSDAGHRDMHRITRRVSAVTAACMVIRRQAFLEVGGLDESAFKVAFNDVDLCLRLAANGYRNVLVGEAQLTHHESKSRGSDFTDENYRRYLGELNELQRRWDTANFMDPYHHPLAMRSSERFALEP